MRSDLATLRRLKSQPRSSPCLFAQRVEDKPGASRSFFGDKNKAERLYQLGADFVFDRHSPDLVEQVIEATDGQGATFVLDLVGRTTLRSSISMLATKGRIVCAGTLSGDLAEINLMDILMKNVSIHGSFAVIQPQDFDQILQHFAEGIFQPVIDSVLPLQEASVAHERIEAKQAFGKIILVPDAEHRG